MARCVAFDKQTARAISRNLHLLAICDTEADPVQSALQSSAATSLLLLPSQNPKRVLVAKFRRSHSALAVSQELSGTDAINFETTGFLGLTDQPIYEPQPQPPRKWWQKIID